MNSKANFIRKLILLETPHRNQIFVSRIEKPKLHEFSLSAAQINLIKHEHSCPSKVG